MSNTTHPLTIEELMDTFFKIYDPSKDGESQLDRWVVEMEAKHMHDIPLSLINDLMDVIKDLEKNPIEY